MKFDHPTLSIRLCNWIDYWSILPDGTETILEDFGQEASDFEEMENFSAMRESIAKEAASLGFTHILDQAIPESFGYTEDNYRPLPISEWLAFWQNNQDSW